MSVTIIGPKFGDAQLNQIEAVTSNSSSILIEKLIMLILWDDA